MYNNHVRKIKTHKNPSGLQPIPMPSKFYCGVCQDQFNNYLTHIESKEHKAKTDKQSDYFREIDKLIGVLSFEAQPRPCSKAVRKFIASEDSSVLSLTSMSMALSTRDQTTVSRNPLVSNLVLQKKVSRPMSTRI